MNFLPSCGHVGTAVWLPHLDSNEMHGDKARWELRKNYKNYFQQNLEAEPHKTAAVGPFAPPSHLTNHPSKTNRIC